MPDRSLGVPAGVPACDVHVVVSGIAPMVVPTFVDSLTVALNCTLQVLGLVTSATVTVTTLPTIELLVIVQPVAEMLAAVGVKPVPVKLKVVVTSCATPFEPDAFEIAVFTVTVSPGSTLVGPVAVVTTLNAGSVMVMEYYKKDKRLDFRLEKMN